MTTEIAVDIGRMNVEDAMDAVADAFKQAHSEGYCQSNEIVIIKVLEIL